MAFGHFMSNTSVVTEPPIFDDMDMLKLAREIAMEIHPLDKILDTHGVTSAEWNRIKTNEHFRRVLANEITLWNSAGTTHERVKIKAAAAVELWLPELFERIHSHNENLTAKIEGGKLLARLADLGIANANINGGGEKFSVTINLGADTQLKFEHDAPRNNVIETEYTEN
jgi:hypothetical protein